MQEGEIEFGEYDLIISATGSHNINRWINQYIFLNKISTPIVYAWNEVLGIGSHVAYIKYGSIGSVSYTHLDVYKRQVSIYDAASIKEWLENT